jgi:hypothetical protein
VPAAAEVPQIRAAEADEDSAADLSDQRVNK